jgi:RNA polymerase sigma-70 factor (ECF subfamily)
MPHNGTEIGGPGAAFPSTLWTEILEARNRDATGFRERLDALVRRYWKPVYWTLRTRWNRSNEEAKDLTQSFFASFLEKDRLSNVGPEKGRFRTFLRVVLDNFMRNELEAAAALKRGGGAAPLPLDALEEMPVQSPAPRPEEAFDRAWAVHVFREAMRDVEAEHRRAGRERQFRVFERHSLDREPPTYAALAAEFGFTVHEVENALKQSRAALAKALRARVRETLADDASVEDELRVLGEALR